MTVYELLTGHIESLERIEEKLYADRLESKFEEVDYYRMKIVRYRDAMTTELAATELGDWPLPHA
jgi:hypothetical protein